MDGAAARVQQAVFTMVNSLDKDGLRKLQADMYRCSTKCCENYNAPLDDVQNCIDQCSTKVNRAQNFIQGEIQVYQDRLQRCVLGCEDKVRDQINPSTSQDDMGKFSKQVEACAVQCADEHIKLIPGLTTKVLDALKKNYS